MPRHPRSVANAALLAPSLAALLTFTVATGGRAQTPAAGAAAPATPKVAAIRVGSHPDFGRVVLDLPPGATGTATSDGDRGVLVRVNGATIGQPGPVPRNVTAILVDGSEARLSLAPGTHFSAFGLQSRLVIDVFDKAGAPAPGASAAPAPAAPITPRPAAPAAPAPAAPITPRPAAPAAPAARASPPPAATAMPAVASDACARGAAAALPAAPAVAPRPKHADPFSGPPPRHPLAAMASPDPTQTLAAPVPPAQATAAPVPPAQATSAPVPPAQATAPPVAPPRAAPAPAASKAPAPPLAGGASRSEPVRVTLQSLLDDQLPSVLRPPPPATPPPPAPVAPAPVAPAAAAELAPLAAPVTEVVRAPLASPGAADAPAKVAAEPMLGGPLAIAAESGGQALMLPFAPTTGAAAFRRGGEIVVVFDERRPIDLAALRDDQGAAFPDARVQLLTAATVLRFPLAPEDGLRLARTDDGWAISRVVVPPVLAPIRGDVADGVMQLAAAAPGAVVSVPDPLTGDALLVGTQLQPGQGVPVTRRTPDFTLLETLQGVAVELASDSLTLRVAPPKQPPGFLIAADSGSAGGGGVALDPLGPDSVAALEAAHVTRRWDFPALPSAALLRRLEASAGDAAAAPPEGRTARRLQAAQAEIALGMGAEANALATLAIGDDARAANSADAAGLAAVGALLAGRLAEADAIADPRLDGTDEVTLWRAARLAMQREGAPEAAQRFAATLPLLLAYPSAPRKHLLPLAAETMVLGGEREAARRLLEARKDDGDLDFARALLAELDGHAAPALALYDRLALSPDRRTRARGAVHAVELRLREGALSTAQAADALDRLLYAWRGGPEELALRLRVADLRTQSGNWRAALALLRETSSPEMSQTWPDQKAAIRAHMADVFAQALASDARAALSPLDLASLVDENPDLLPDGEPGRALAARLAERLVALDLPKRAAPVLQKLMDATQPGAAKAELGARLAAVKLEQADPTGALLALSASAITGLPAALDEARTIAFARATAARGALAPATAALSALDTAGADEARAALLEHAKDWPGAVAALSSFVARTVPTDGMLAEASARLLLRLASDAAQAADEPLLARLRARELARMPAGKTADLFRIITESPVQGVGDLPRAAQEARLARDVPADLKALGTLAAPP